MSTASGWFSKISSAWCLHPPTVRPARTSCAFRARRVLPVDETKEAGAQHVVGEVLDEFVVGSEEASEHLPPEGRMMVKRSSTGRWGCEARDWGRGNALVGGDHIVAREVEEVVEIVVQVLLHLLAGDRQKFPLDHQLVEPLC